MKNLTLIAFLSLFIFGIGSVNAQSVAHVNSNEILQAMPEYKAAQTKLEAEANRHRSEVERQTKEMESVYTDAQKQMESVKDKAEAEQRAMMQKLAPVQQDLQTKQQALSQYQKTATESLTKMEGELMKPIYDKVEAAITKVGDKKKVGYIIDMATTVPSGVLLYFKGGTDLTNDVKKELGL
ncbi:MAG: OmpH family outer membrane protein [Weeksellaceae bacterium]